MAKPIIMKDAVSKINEIWNSYNLITYNLHCPIMSVQLINNVFFCFTLSANSNSLFSIILKKNKKIIINVNFIKFEIDTTKTFFECYNNTLFCIANVTK